MKGDKEMERYDELLSDLKERFERDNRKLQLLKGVHPFLQKLVKDVQAKYENSSVELYWGGINSISISVYRISIDDVIEDLCGPIHRRYGRDWTMEPDASGSVAFLYKIPIDTFENVYINLFSHEGIDASCKIVLISSKPSTWEEKKYAIECR
uniref:Uncharacterized protein n=2 Tax=viral metagenome TaxID=1070528 RepID=A0A6M3X4Y8_9ZZZZ